jgi:SAM-dependent methyltransferase
MTHDKDLFNIMGAVSQANVDEANREFYGAITYPWPQLTYPSYGDPHYGTVFVNQELGDWTHSRIPRRPKIWVAGCGSNQATLTALKFPKSEILATDISTPSLSLCEKNLSQLGVKNVSLAEESVNAATYREEFDYIVCTGVVHHNADPSIPLAKLAEALRPDGVLELGVYNYYHRILTTAYQKAMRHLFNDGATDLNEQLEVTRALMNSFPLKNTMGFYLQKQQHESREFLADSFLQPVEHSFTIESLGELLEGAQMELCVPCLSVFDKAAGRLSWNLEFENPRVAASYDTLSDLERWQVSNLLMIEESPSLFFYAQRHCARFKRKSEREICDDFLAARFERYAITVNNYVGVNGNYRLSPTPIPLPSPRLPVDETARRIFKTVDSERTVREVFKALNIEPTFYLVNRMRIQLTTPLFPYLRSIAPEDGKLESTSHQS